MEEIVPALEAFVDPLLLCAADGHVVQANAAARRWFRLDRGPWQPELRELLSAVAAETPPVDALLEAVRTGQPWEGRLDARSESGAIRRGLIRCAPGALGAEPSCVLVQVVDITRPVERLTAEAERDRANLLVDLLGSTAGDLGDAVASLRWAASLPDAQLAEIPARMRAPMLELRGNARRLHDLFRNLSESLPPGVAAPAPGKAESSLVGEAAIRVLLVGSAPVPAAQLLDGLRRAELPCVARTVETREAALRAALAGEVEVVLVGAALGPEEARELVKSLAQHAPRVAVFDPRGVAEDVLVRGIRGAVRERRRRDQAREAWRSIEEIALRDALTSVFNRRALDRFARLEFARAERYGVPLALALFDMDHFKELNDSLGHAAGDRALQVFAQALQAGVREMDLVARLGGDEFVVLMPHTDPQGALLTIQRLRAAAERAVRSVLPEADPLPGASVGLAAYPADDVRGYEDLLARADQELYRAKRDRHRKLRKRALRSSHRG